jgi:hypothetical protein
VNQTFPKCQLIENQPKKRHFKRIVLRARNKNSITVAEIRQEFLQKRLFPELGTSKCQLIQNQPEVSTYSKTSGKETFQAYRFAGKEQKQHNSSRNKIGISSKKGFFLS